MGYKVVKKNNRESFLGQSREKFVNSWLEEAQIIGVRETTLREPVPDTGCPGEKTLRVELGLRLWNVQDIWMGVASQSSSSSKLLRSLTSYSGLGGTWEHSSLKSDIPEVVICASIGSGGQIVMFLFVLWTNIKLQVQQGKLVCFISVTHVSRLSEGWFQFKYECRR